MDLENMMRLFSRIITLESCFLKQNIEYFENQIREEGLHDVVKIPESPEITLSQKAYCQVQAYEIGGVSDENKLA
jgi:hypothetical protein